jgi:hypothetical protein
MTAATKKKVGRVKAIHACAITVAARAPVYETVIVRDRRTGKLAEVELNPERPPLDEGDPGRFYAFTRGEEVSADLEAVLDAPAAFEPVDD